MKTLGVTFRVGKTRNLSSEIGFSGLNTGVSNRVLTEPLCVYSILQGFSRHEFRDHFLCDVHGFASLRVSAFPCASLVDLESAESYQLNCFIFLQRACNF